MKIKANLTLICHDEIESKNIYEALNPDNRNIPKDLGFDFRREGEKIYITLESSNLGRIRSTLDEFLSLISSIEKL